MVNRLARLGLTAAFALALAPLAKADIALPGDMTFPESIGSTADGTLFVGSPGAGGVIRVRPGQEPEPFIKPAAFDGGTAKLETLRDGMDGPTGVTRVGDKAYVTEGQLSHLFGGAGGKGQHLPFKVYEVPLK